MGKARTPTPRPCISSLIWFRKRATCLLPIASYTREPSFTFRDRSLTLPLALLVWPVATVQLACAAQDHLTPHDSPSGITYDCATITLMLSLFSRRIVFWGSPWNTSELVLTLTHGHGSARSERCPPSWPSSTLSDLAPYALLVHLTAPPLAHRHVELLSPHLLVKTNLHVVTLTTRTRVRDLAAQCWYACQGLPSVQNSVIVFLTGTASLPASVA